jgi:hypothetical protein
VYADAAGRSSATIAAIPLAGCVGVPPGVVCQDEAGRLWDVVRLLRLAIGRGDGGPEVRFGVHVRNDNRERTPPLVRLKTVSGRGDDEGPVLTVMMPGNDQAKSETVRRGDEAARVS